MDQNQEKSLFALLNRNGYSKAATFAATGCYSGFSPLAPGTIGSLIFFLLWHLAYRLFPQDIGFQIFVTFDLIVIALLSTEVVLRELRLNAIDDTDPQFIVIDEWAGLSLALLGLAEASLFATIIAFLLFRTLDIAKLPPVRWGELLPRSYGVIADDLIAGAITLSVMQIFV